MEIKEEEEATECSDSGRRRLHSELALNPLGRLRLRRRRLGRDQKSLVIAKSHDDEREKE
jgi:hypothetical protein